MPRRWLFVGILALPSVALAKDFTHDTATHSWTAVSGYGGDFVERTFGSTLGLRDMFFMEKFDNPKTIEADGRTLRSVDASSPTGDRKTLEVDGGASSSTQVIDVGDTAYITAIQVCTNDKKDSFDNKLKGLKAWGATIRTDGTLQANPTAQKFERPNCEKWRTKVECPAGKVATGVRAYWQFPGRGFAGMSLRCTKPK